MKLKRFYSYLAIFLVSLFMLTGCGGNGSSGGDANGTAPTPSPTVSPSPVPSPSPSPTVTKTKGYLIDSALQGVSYVCDGKEALTDINGMFECVEAPVTFKIGALTLGTLNAFTADGKVYLQDLLGVKRDTYSDEKLKLLARLVQSLDDDGNIATTITITKEVRDALSKKQNFNTMTEQQVRLLVEGLGKRFVEECEAVKHLGDSSVSCGSDGDYYVNGGGIVTPPDTTPPTITLKGDNPYFLKIGTNYEEAGYSSNEQGQIKVENRVDGSKEGEYVITYSTSDLAGNYSEVNRTVNVIKFDDVGQKFTLDEGGLPDELKGKLELYGIMEDSNGKNGTAGGLTDVVANKKITYKDIDGNKVTKPIIVYRSFNIGEWKGKINEETTLLARMFINPNLIEISESKKIEYIQFIKTEYSDEYKEALRLQALSISSSFFTPHYYDVVSSLQNIILSKYLSEQPKQSQKLNKSVFNPYYKYNLKDKSFTNMALMQIKTAEDDIEFANYADVYYGVRVKKYDNKKKSFDYPMLISDQKLFTVNPVKGGAVGGLYDWATNQFDITYKPTTKIKYNELFGVNADITGKHKALIELYKWQGGYPTLLNGTRGISLLVKTVASGAAGEEVMNSFKKGLDKIQKSLDKAENIVYGVDASLSVMETGLDLFEYYNEDLKDTIKPYRDTYDRFKKVVTDAYGVLKIKPYSPNVKDLGELKQLKQLLGGVIPIVPSNSKNTTTREILQNKIDSIVDKKVKFKVMGTALLLNKVIEPLIKSSAEGRKAIKDFNTKYESTISFSQVAYYMGLRIKGKIKEREIGGKINKAIAEYSRTFISKKIFKSMKTTLSKYMNVTAQIPKALSFMKKLVTGGSKVIKDPIKAIKNIATFLIEAEIVNLKAIAGDGILNVIARANPAGAAVKGAQIVNDWSSYLAGNVAVANKQYFQVDFDNGKVDIHLPPVTFSGVGTTGNIRPLKTVQNYFNGTEENSHRFLVAIDGKSTNVKHRPEFNIYFTEENQDGIIIDGDLEDLLETDAYKNKTIFKFDLNLDKSNNNTEDENSFTIATDGIKNIEIKSEDIVSADLSKGKNNMSYLDIMEAWEEKGANAYIINQNRGLFKESVTVEMMPSTNPAFIIEGNLRQKSVSYYSYQVANKALIKDAIKLSIEEDKNNKKVLSIKNNASYTICYEVKYDEEDGIIDDTYRTQGNCILAGKTFVDDELDSYSDGTGKMNDVVFYFYDELAIKFFKQESIVQPPYLYRYQKHTKKVVSNIIAYSVDFDKIENNTLPPQIATNDIKISTTTQDITLDWNDLDRATSYQVCISTKHITEGNSCEAEGGILLDSDSSGINIKENLQPNVVYYIRVSGVKNDTNGLWSNEVTTSLLERTNTPPTANAGKDKKNVSIDAEVHLSGKDSNDTEGDPLTYLWSFVSKPSNSSATLSDATIVNPTFTADENGTYTIQLIVNDGFSNSSPDTVVIETDEEAPVKEVNPTSCTPEFD